MPKTKIDPLRKQLADFIDFGDAHATAESAMAELDHSLQGTRPAGVAHSAWELLEHLRITQHDILDFAVNPKYKQQTWPDDYWPKSASPPSADAWKKSVAAFRKDCDALRAMAEDPEIDLFAKIPHGDGETYLRELLLAQDHLSYHVAQLVIVRQLLGAWPPPK